MKKKILITGKNSYIGSSFSELKQNKYNIQRVSLRNGKENEIDFSEYDVVLHCAGIAHNSTKQSMEKEYYEVNHELTVEVAKKAKATGVKQFIYLSSIIVFGQIENGKISKHTRPNPENFYGKSKLLAERDLKALQDKDFTVSILRPPMVYGENSKGNFPKLAKLSKKTKLFPNIENKRSVIYIRHLCNYIEIIIDNQIGGIFHPRNSDYVSTSKIVKSVSEESGNKILFVDNLDTILRIILRKKIYEKIFGDFYYDESLIDIPSEKYNQYSFEETIKLIENKAKEL